MKPNETAKKDLKARLLAELKRDPKRAVVMGVLGLVLFVLGGRLVLKQIGPSAATAAAVKATPKTAKKPLAPGVGKAAAEAAARSAATAAQKVLLDRDLFRPNPAFFPPAKPAAPAVSTAKVVQDDPAARQAAAKKKVLAEAHSLGLQTTMVGSSPTAMINGQVLRVGDVIRGFQVVEISSRSCTLVKDEVRVTLEMLN
jgi:hypothetical protein